MTRQIQLLEQDLGVELLIRTPRGVELTQAGALFLDEARNVLALLDQASDRVKRTSEGILGRLDVAIFGSAILKHIPSIILEFKRQYPKVKVTLQTLDKARQIEALRNRSIDVGFNRMLMPTEGIVIEEIAREKLYAAVLDTGPLSRRSRIDLRELSGQPMLLFPAIQTYGFVEKVYEICQEAGFVPNVTQIVGDALTAMALVASGFGVCLVPESVVALHIPGVKFLPLTGPLQPIDVDLSCIYRDGDNSPVLHNFLRICRSTVGHLDFSLFSAVQGRFGGLKPEGRCLPGCFAA